MTAERPLHVVALASLLIRIYMYLNVSRKHSVKLYSCRHTTHTFWGNVKRVGCIHY